MSRRSILWLVLLLGTVRAGPLQRPSDGDSRMEKGTDALAIVVTKLDVNDTRLELSYEIRNASAHEVWICDDIGFEEPFDSEVFVSEGGGLVTLRRRLDVPSRLVWFRRPRGKYVRLRPGESRRESWCVDVPIEGYYIFMPHPSPKTPATLFNASRLAIEIGYYEGNLPETMIDMIEEAEKTYVDGPGAKPPVLEAFGDVSSFNFYREQLRSRDDEIVIPYMYQELKGEKLLRTVVDGLRIPWKIRKGLSDEEKQRYSLSDFDRDLRACTRLEIRFTPSAIEYFFPFAVNQSLFNDEELNSLKSEHGFSVQDRIAISLFAGQLAGGYPFREVARTNDRIHFDGYRDSDHAMAFDMYGNLVLDVGDGRRLSYLPGKIDLGVLLPKIRKLEHRVGCAVNLRDLYHRLRLYAVLVARDQKESSGKSVVSYPAAATSDVAYHAGGSKAARMSSLVSCG